MDRPVALTWSWLNVLTRKRYDALRGVYGSMEKALEHLDEEMLKQLGCRDDTVMKTLVRREEFDPELYEEELRKRDLKLLTIEDEDYPAVLREIGDPPVFLYARGDLSILDQPCIGLVGTREMSIYGQRVVQHFVPDLVRAGMVTVSGLALGIDAEVAKETLEAGGKTVAVLGHGLGSIYPKQNAELAEEIAENGGLILSEFPLDVSPDKFTFPARNRIIAGLSLGTVVLEAGEGSGAIITAELALDYGREVFAVPGQIFDPHAVGCHQLISKGQAKLVSEPREILQELGIIASQRSENIVYEPQSPEEEALLKVLTSMPQTVGDLVDRSKLETGTLNATLTMMELSGAAKNVGGGMWVRN